MEDVSLLECEAPRPQGGASRARSGEREASKGSFFRIVPLDSSLQAGSRGMFRSELMPFEGLFGRDSRDIPSPQSIIFVDHLVEVLFTDKLSFGRTIR